MTTEIAQPRNQVLDVLEALSKAGSMFFGSGTTTTQKTVDPKAAASTENLARMLEARGSSTFQVDKVIEDILYRAQLAFAPVLEAEKKAGMYNTTTRNQLAQETVARATAASAQAVLEDQQRAFAQAAMLRDSQMKSSSSSSQKTGASINPRQLLTGATSAVIGSTALKKGKEAIKGIIDSVNAPGKGYGASGAVADIADNLYDPDSIEAMFADGGAGTPVGFGEGGGSAFGAGGDSFISSGVIADDTAALQSIIDSTTVPTISEGTQVADSGQIMTDAESPSLLMSPQSMQTAQGAVDMGAIGSVDDAATIGEIGTQKAIEGATLEATGIDIAAPDLFAFDPASLGAGAAASGGSTAAASGLTAAEGAGIAEGMAAGAGSAGGAGAAGAGFMSYAGPAAFIAAGIEIASNMFTGSTQAKKQQGVNFGAVDRKLYQNDELYRSIVDQTQQEHLDRTGFLWSSNSDMNAVINDLAARYESAGGEAEITPEGSPRELTYEEQIRLGDVSSI